MESHKIIVKNTCIIINDYELGDAPNLEKQFTIFDKLTFTVSYFGLYYDTELKRLFLPRGIDIWFVEKQLESKAFIDKNSDRYLSTTQDLMISKLPRDDNQKEALRFILGKNEYSITKQHSQLSLNLSTGKGKSYCSIASAAYESVKFAIITSSTDCLLQWLDYIHEYSPEILDKNICMIKGSGVIHRLFQTGTDKYDIFLISYGTISSYAKSYGWEKITELFKLLNIGTKIIDEAHQFFLSMMMLDFYTNTRKTLYVTATKGRSSEDENRIYQLYFKNVLAIDLFDQAEDPHTKYKAMMYNSHPTPYQISKCKNAYGLNRMAYVNYLIDQPNFFKLLSVVIDMAISHNAKTLIYIGTNDAILKTYEWIIETFPNIKNDIGIYTSIIQKNIKQDALKKLIILSTTKSCGAAMDIKGLKITVVAAEPFKSDIIAIQTLGRTRDKNTIYIEFVDTGFYYTKYYYTCKKPIFSKYALDMSNIKLSDDELDDKYLKILSKYSPVVNNLLRSCINITNLRSCINITRRI